MKISECITLLGQSGCILNLGETVIYVDPYLSNSVAELDSSELIRQREVAVYPSDVKDADWVFLTHEHIDHCDPHTIPDLATASPNANFFGPPAVLANLRNWEIGEDRLRPATEAWVPLTEAISVIAIPAAHPNLVRDKDGRSRFVGYLFRYSGHLIYIAGDTSPHQEILDALKQFSPIDVALLPVNERNFFRDRRGIVGNMSVREAFQFADEINCLTVIPVHWDMFKVNSAAPEEIRLLFDSEPRGFELDFGKYFGQKTSQSADVSVVVRTLNEEQHLNDLLVGINEQVLEGLTIEVVLVDSGSTDRTIKIAEKHGCKIQHIDKSDFTFGRSLNIGCEAASGRYLVFTSGHCVPADKYWLDRLIAPLRSEVADYTYGRQVGGVDTYFSEHQIFEKYFPADLGSVQGGDYCNNANSAVSARAWEQHRFDEELTGLEDIKLAQDILRDRGNVTYVPEATVMHFHSESWSQVRTRFEREAIALQRLKPQIQVTALDTMYFLGASLLLDLKTAIAEKKLMKSWRSIFLYRYNQYVGTYLGHQHHRELSTSDKKRFFYPT